MSDDNFVSELYRSIDSLHPGYYLAGGVTLIFVLTICVSALTAPPITSGDFGPSENQSANGTGHTLVGLQGPFQDSQGFAKLLSRNGSVVWQSDESWANFDVSPLSDNRVLTAFTQKDAIQCGPYTPPCARTGFRIYDYRSDTLLREWTYPTRHHRNREVHDVEMMPNGDVLVVGMDRERIFTVDPTGSITWQWNASSYYDPPEDPTRTDWLHMNDVDRIGEDRYLVSVRNKNQILIIDRDEGVVEVINEDGDPDVIEEQHNPQWLGDGGVLVADSQNDRVVELAERNGTWEVAWELRGTGGLGFHWPRDVDLLANGNLLVTDSFNDRVVEVQRNGSLVWSVSPGRIPYEADRLPYGEYPNQTLNQFNGSMTPGGSGITTFDIPGLSLAFSSIVGTLSIPYWINQWHFLFFVLTIGSVICGLVWVRVG